MPDSKTTTVYIDLNALKHNYLYAKSLAPNSRTMAVIKANAYGHGMVRAATALSDVADGLAVANINEGIKLREHGIQVEPLLILQGANDVVAWEQALSHRLTPMVQNESQIAYALSSSWPSSVPIWVKVDTGMHRLGLPPALCDAIIPSLVNKFGKNGFVLCSHFACSDEVGLSFNTEQLEVLRDIQRKHDLQQWSIANSGGILSIPESHGAWNRAGFMLYGNSPLQEPHPNDKPLKPVMTLTGPVIAVRDLPPGEHVGYSRTFTTSRVPTTRIATVAMGYGDGYPRHAPNGTPVLIKGQRAPLAGRVSMDMITVDVSDITPPVEVGDEVCVWGNGLSVNEVAEKAGTIGYEVLTKFTDRPKKVYIEPSS
mmetsp:Transcript_4977/g.7600  ORF Transcript_4977/g.7600 Transcript_4977/m.7600 type:complete len:370 (-) Transcript_4977:121-1230(-)